MTGGCLQHPLLLDRGVSQSQFGSLNSAGHHNLRRHQQHAVHVGKHGNLRWQSWHVKAEAASGVPGGGALSGQEGEPTEAPKSRLRQMLSPFKEASANRRLLALCCAQALCSVATLIHDTYLPLYLQDVLGLSNTRTGNLYAVSQFLCNASKSLSGTLADFLSPARMVIFGTLLTTINKPMFAMSGYVYASFGTVACLYWVTAGKVFDRMSKGIREAPGKALIGDLAREAGDRTEGAFSLRQSMATFGALLGSAIAGLAFRLSGSNYILTFALSAIPASAALLLVTTAFGKGATAADAANKKKRKDAADKAAADGIEELSLGQKAKAFLKALQPAYWQALAVVSLLYFARFDASFITLRARTVMAKSQLPLVTSMMMVTQAVLATPVGLRAKRSIGARNGLLLLGFGAMISADLVFALTNNAAGMFVGAALVGVHMAMTHGICLSMISAYIPAGEIPGLGRVSGTVWSFTDFVLGVVLAYSNSLAGKLTDLSLKAGYGNTGCFYGGAAATVLSGIVLLVAANFLDLGREDLLIAKKG